MSAWRSWLGLGMVGLLSLAPAHAWAEEVGAPSPASSAPASPASSATSGAAAAPLAGPSSSAPPVAASSPAGTPAAGATPSDADPWCAAELDPLAHDVCYAKGPPSADGRRTLVIFLHGLTDVGSGWQRTMQKGMAAYGKRFHFDLIAPKGRVGIGPGKKANQYAWPASSEGQRTIEDEVVAEWMEAKKTLEARDGAYDEVFVMGFSNGAYYSSSLALRGKLAVDGYAVFAGGSAPKGSESRAKSVKARVPVFVGIASKDETAKKGKELAKLLADLKWPHKTNTKPVGHVVADDQLEAALSYLRKEKAKPAAVAAQTTKKAKAKKAKKGDSAAPTSRASQTKKPKKKKS